MAPPRPSEVNLDFLKFVVEQIQTAQKPMVDGFNAMREEVGNMREAIGSVNGRLAEGDRRLSDHSEFIDYARPLLERCKTGGHSEVATTTTTTTTTQEDRRVHWAVMILLGGALTWVGERGIQVLVNAFADKPSPVVSPVVPAVPSHP